MRRSPSVPSGQFVVHSVERRPGRRASALVPLLMVLATASNCGCFEEEPVPHPPVEIVEILPASLYAIPGARFALRVRLRSDFGQLLPDSHASEAVWSLDSEYLAERERNGPWVVLEVVGGSPTEDSPARRVETKVRASVDGRTGEATVTIIQPINPASVDWAHADHAANAPPVLAVVDGMVDAWRNDTLIAFAGWGVLDAFKAHCRTPSECGQMTLLSRDQRVGHVDLNWTDADDFVKFSTGPLPTASPIASEGLAPPPIPVPVQIWVAATGDRVRGTIDADFANAEVIFRDAWTGLTFDDVTNDVSPDEIILDVAAPEWKCPSAVRSQIEALGVPSASIAPGRINVVYVEDIVNAEDGLSSLYRGYTCPWDRVNGTIVLVSWLHRVHSTLAHELGHAIGKWGKPGFGHTNLLTGFTEANLMWLGESSLVPASRFHISLGQVFRLSVDTGALVNKVGLRIGATKDCQALVDDGDRPCPLPSLDFSRPE